ncbi:hypothetical protein AA101099_2062 [Neoasaia chiangmaiensis NBRC 101099]|nr:hypothetical protein AA101099_2062 [Neoasaia chiangmaiensis NBRC 101099]
MLLADVGLAQAADIDVHSVGAACDGRHDDQPAFQSALDRLSADGGELVFSGTCRIDRPLIVHDTNMQSITIDGRGGTLLSHGNDILHFSLPADTHTSPTVALRDIRLKNDSGHLAGSAIVLDNAAVTGTSAGFQSPTIRDVIIDGFLRGIVLHDVGSALVSHVTITDVGNPQSEAIRIEGSSSKRNHWANNNFFENVTVVGGYGFHLVGAIQGVNITNSKVMLGTYGVKDDNDDSTEGVQITASYFEGHDGGIVLRNYSLVQFNGNSFDSTPNGLARDWHAIAIGDESANIYPMGIQIIGNQVSGFGQTTSPPFQIAAGQAVVSGNMAIGLADHDRACMRLATPENAKNDAIVLSGNDCWAAHGYDIRPGSHIIGDSNAWTGPHHDTLIRFPPPPLP